MAERAPAWACGLDAVAIGESSPPYHLRLCSLSTFPFGCLFLSFSRLFVRYTPFAVAFAAMHPLFVVTCVYLALSLPLVASFPSERLSASCGIRGYDKGRPTAYFYSRSSKYGSASACGARCALDSKCSSYGFGDDTCLGYAAIVWVPPADKASLTYGFANML